MGGLAVQAPGEDWLAIVSRPSLTDFAQAFVEAPVLEASVLLEPMMGFSALRAFFDATRAMYEAIAFTAEHRAGSWTWLEWRGEYGGRPISGATVLVADRGLIAKVRIFHAPLDQLNAFATDLRRRLDRAPQGDGRSK